MDSRSYSKILCILALAAPTSLRAQTAPPAASTTAPPPAAATPTAPKKTSSASGAPIFPAKLSSKYASEKPGEARLHTCLDQYHANKNANGNGSLKWIQKGGGYYSVCSKKLKA